MSGQNTSFAVMAQRVEPHDSLDFFPTPPWATRALCEHVLHPYECDFMNVWEPCAGNGDMASPLHDYFPGVAVSDVHPYPFVVENGRVIDFLGMEALGRRMRYANWIITNPPFNLALPIVLRGLEHGKGVAVLVRTAWLESEERYSQLFKPHPPSVIAQFSERVPMIKNMLDPAASSATAYCWVVWSPWRGDAQRVVWIPPCRRELERPGDYDGYAELVAARRAMEATEKLAERERKARAAAEAAGAPYVPPAEQEEMTL